jgi:hypothetical protein
MVKDPNRRYRLLVGLSAVLLSLAISFAIGLRSVKEQLRLVVVPIVSFIVAAELAQYLKHRRVVSERRSKHSD